MYIDLFLVLGAWRLELYVFLRMFKSFLIRAVGTLENWGSSINGINVTPNKVAVGADCPDCCLELSDVERRWVSGSFSSFVLGGWLHLHRLLRKWAEPMHVKCVGWRLVPLHGVTSLPCSPSPTPAFSYAHQREGRHLCRNLFLQENEETWVCEAT